MAGQTKLFEKINGLLVEVDPSEADARRNGRRVSSMALVIDVLLTQEEEDARDAQEAAYAKRRAAQEAASAEAAERRAAAIAKLEALGLSKDELQLLLP